MPIPYAPHKLSQPSTSQPRDTSEASPASVLLSGEHNPPPPNTATDGPPPGQDGNKGSGETEKQILKVSLASSIISARVAYFLFIQDSPNNADDKVQRVRIEPERTGWARMYDLVREYDKNRIIDNKEDIDTLLVFVSLVLVSLGFGI